MSTILIDENSEKLRIIHAYDDYKQNGKAEGKPRAREERKEAEMTESKGNMRGDLIDASSCFVSTLNDNFCHDAAAILLTMYIRNTQW